MRTPGSIVATLLLVLRMPMPADAQGATWKPVGLNGFITALSAVPGAPGTLLANVNDQGLYRSDDGGAIWLPVLQGSASTCFPAEINVYLLTADPQLPGVMYAGSPGALFKSSDGGATWAMLSGLSLGAAVALAAAPGVPGSLLAGVEQLTLDPPGQCLDGNLTGLAASHDGGASWSILVRGQYTSLAFDPAVASRVYLGTPQGAVLQSDDGGATATALPSLPETGGLPNGVVLLRIDPTTQPSTLYAVVQSAPLEVYRAMPGAGEQPFWTPITAGLPATAPVNDFAVDPQVPGNLYAATGAGVYASTDRGKSWSSIGENDNFYATVLALDPRTLGPLYAGTDGAGLYVLDRGGCAASDTVACAVNARFRLTVTQGAGGGPAAAVALSDQAGAFWFFDPGSYDLFAKVLDGRSINGAFWVFAGGLSNAGYTLTVADAVTGDVKTYANAPGQLRSFADVNAFPQLAHPDVAPVAAAPAAPAGVAPGLAAATAAPRSPRPAEASSAGATAAGSTCLDLDGFQVQVAFHEPTSQDGVALPLTSTTGAFWLAAPDNPEVGVKLLDGRALNGHFWVFAGSMTELPYTLTVTETSTGAVRTYSNPAGRATSIADTSAF
jgi:photosystem II stability/assembly factor-like uncharacterized protein